MVKNKKKKKNIRTKKQIPADKKLLDEIIRVDQAGELGATKIYAGQLAVFGKESNIGKKIKHMADQEQEHIDTFNRLIVEKKVEPVIEPVIKNGGFAVNYSYNQQTHIRDSQGTSYEQRSGGCKSCREKKSPITHNHKTIEKIKIEKESEAEASVRIQERSILNKKSKVKTKMLSRE